MSDRFLEQRINTEFCVKLISFLRKNASYTNAMLSKACEGEYLKKSSVFSVA
jgi:hypothetical protein